MRMARFAVAGLQLEAANDDNLDRMEAEIEQAVRRFPWLDMVVLPELNAFGTRTDNAVAAPGPVEERFVAQARRLGIWLLPGSYFERRGAQVFNTAPVISPAGEVVARHRKLFPWLPYEEGVTAGGEFVVFDVPGVGRFGVSICYDMWFPETIRTLAWLGAEVILHPSLTSTIDRQAELAMIRAHAAINQCYFFDVNLAGPLGVGESCIAGPGGEIVYQAGKGREIIPLKLDLDYVRDVREHGWHNLCQSLKSFRDSPLEYPPYGGGQRSAALDALGPLRRATRRRDTST
jgi:deaminated glutathione amidase